VNSRKGNRRFRRNLWLIAAAGGGVSVLVIGYASITAHSGGKAADSASVSTYGNGSQNGSGGWGRGGYMMMPGPTGSASNGSTPESATNAAATTSENWAGYASAGDPGTFTSVSSSWTEPAVTCGATNTFSSFWVGLDGDGTDSVEQTGTEADCDAGAASYQGWFEMFPNAPVFYDNTVDPGDAMSATVTSDGGGTFTLTLEDATQDWTQTTNQTSTTAQLGSAEIIAEAPSDGTVLPLSNFGTVDFTNATINNTAVGDENASALTMVSAGGVTEATPSALTGDNAFTVTWDSDGESDSAATAAAASASPSAAAAADAEGETSGQQHHHHHF
jgi:Peptidase A4 family